jgi:putative alpha-1,2-mannosidase
MISFVSIEQARLNLDTEITLPFGWNFDAVYTDAGERWNNLLGAIQVKGRDETDLKKFYTNLYRVYVGRTIYSDVNGKYVDMYEKVQQLKNTDLLMYGGDAFWNTFWNLNQVWTLRYA